MHASKGQGPARLSSNSDYLQKAIGQALSLEMPVAFLKIIFSIGGIL
jgi:hypothetical protein